MVEILRPQASGISALLELARMVIPSDHEFCGFEDDDGTFHSYEQLKALEGQENQVDSIQKAISSLEQAIKKTPRTAKAIFENSATKTKYMLCNDDTLWVLACSASGDRWSQMTNIVLPPVPQEGV